MRTMYCVAVMLVMASAAWAQEKDKLDAVGIVRKHIDSLANGQGAGEVIAQSSAAVKQAFPDHQLVIVRFRIFPVARIMPEGLRASNLFAVSKEGKIEHVKDVKTMQKFFAANHTPANNQKDTKTVLMAWLTLTPEFHQDGMFKFEVMDATVDGANANGKVVVMAGGNGQLTAELQFKDGKLASALEKATIRAGLRPICQATKLLDADPIVRRIAEQNLIIMGLSARDYIMDQRQRATPELRDAIDRVWRQIEKNGW